MKTDYLMQLLEIAAGSLPRCSPSNQTYHCMIGEATLCLHSEIPAAREKREGEIKGCISMTEPWIAPDTLSYHSLFSVH